MTDNFTTYVKEYTDAAGLKPTDMPSSHHPLLESNDEVGSLSDLIDVRSETSPNGIVDDAERRSSISHDDEDSYMTEADFVSEMNASDPDGDTGMDRDDYI